MDDHILKLEGITKVYPNGIVANKDVSFSVKVGEIHALMGENGAGKSTLMKMIFGIEKPDEGSIWLNGSQVEIKSPDAAIKLGIGMVHQHFMLVPSLTVTENMILGIEPTKRGFVDVQAAMRMTREIAEKYNLHVDPQAKVADLPVGMKQRIEILKALLRGAKILILDEPTAVLTPQETEELFKQLLLLKENGHTIIFISHKLKEIKDICNRITIMRAGRSVGVYEVDAVSEEDISRLMVGRDVVIKYDKQKNTPGATVLKIDKAGYMNAIGKQMVKGVSFEVREGEIVGIAGVEGNGQRELVDMIAGLSGWNSGEVLLQGQNTKSLSIRQIRELGMAHIPEDRMTFGVAREANIQDNLISNRVFDKRWGSFFLNKKRIKEMAEKSVENYRVKCESSEQIVQMLSGGNIQKVVVARELALSPKLLIADQPTRGIDIGAAEFIHKKLIELRDEGNAILLISADLNEVMELSDRLLVMYGGEVVAEFGEGRQVTEKELGLCMLGLNRTSENIGEQEEQVYGIRTQ
ncbi:ABC transporter ATP-binding protein [Paenibacillus pectinilyticus]|uniref:ABC transporter ATP-binding protein n=1 Tax=Paenibacillus pectinilyticus TaxID=512399 RepID=A0A1C1A2I9_9BACL|nr:ABC transporter ATP-binding protein [Paenibacillus pectinilyticus]OCT14738.1 ABC transporter ATP-binding protein [Paenibacillus pectinilyticus]